MSKVNWNYYDRFDGIYEKYLPDMGEGETMATQTVTAICKLVYKWYNDGDVSDNVHTSLEGWCNDLSSYANWLYKYVDADMLYEAVFETAYGLDEEDYEYLLKMLADTFLNDEKLEALNRCEKKGTVYNCYGPFEFNEEEEDEDDEWWY